MEETNSRYFIILWSCIIFMPRFYKNVSDVDFQTFGLFYQRILEEGFVKDFRIHLFSTFPRNIFMHYIYTGFIDFHSSQHPRAGFSRRYFSILCCFVYCDHCDHLCDTLYCDL